MLSNAEARKLLAEAMDLSRIIKSNAQSAKQNNCAKNSLKRIHRKLKTYHCKVQENRIPVAQIPLEVRQCFVESLLLQTRYQQLLTKPTGGNYKSPIIDSYQCDRIPELLQPEKLCQQFELSVDNVIAIDRKLKEVDRKITRQKTIIKALLDEFNFAVTQTSILKLFQQLFGNIPLPKVSVKCLTTEMQVIFIIDYRYNRLQNKNLWQKLSTDKQQAITSFLNKISSFSWQQFARFPGFGYVENINPQLLQLIIEKTGYSKPEIITAISSSINIVAAEQAESFLLHDIWGHYWQYLLTNFDYSYQYLSQADRDLTIDSSISSQEREIKLLQLFKPNNEKVDIDKPLAIDFFHGAVKERLSHLTTHIVAEILADINEYKWLSQNKRRQELLPSSSCLKDFPSKLDLLLQDLDFLYEPILQPLINSNKSNLIQELTQKLGIKNTSALNSALEELNLIFSQEYTTKYQPIIDKNNNQIEFIKFVLNLLQLSNLLNKIYTQVNLPNLVARQDLLIIFTATYYRSKSDIKNLTSDIAKYFLPCCLWVGFGLIHKLEK